MPPILQIESLVAALRQQLRKLDTFCIHINQPEVRVGGSCCWLRPRQCIGSAGVTLV